MYMNEFDKLLELSNFVTNICVKNLFLNIFLHSYLMQKII